MGGSGRGVNDYDQEAQFLSLLRHFGVEADARGESHIVCPFCGKEPKRGQVHASFSVSGFNCFVCGHSCGLKTLARTVSAEDWEAPKYATVVKSKARAGLSFDTQEWMGRYERHPRRNEVWARYKPVPLMLLKSYHLGFGVAPEHTSQCQHDRLQVPLIAQGNVVGFRSRSVACDCRKWLSPSGSSMVLYNGERLGIQGPTIGQSDNRLMVRGRALFILENPIDALLWEWEFQDVATVATLGVSTWKDEWTEAVRHCGAKVIFVMFDADRPGNGGGETGRRAWMETHKQDIEPNGVRLANRLNAAGIPARLWAWKEDEFGFDAGKLMQKLAEKPLDKQG